MLVGAGGLGEAADAMMMYGHPQSYPAAAPLPARLATHASTLAAKLFDCRNMLLQSAKYMIAHVVLDEIVGTCVYASGCFAHLMERKQWHAALASLHPHRAHARPHHTGACDPVAKGVEGKHERVKTSVVSRPGLDLRTGRRPVRAKGAAAAGAFEHAVGWARVFRLKP